ncbi:MAG: hypothetical protein K2X66_00460 [Cyanobacteria bacterium]|nr:hypothetical protein [Cyanobacteriota bacterium]
MTAPGSSLFPPQHPGTNFQIGIEASWGGGRRNTRGPQFQFTSELTTGPSQPDPALGFTQAGVRVSHDFVQDSTAINGVFKGQSPGPMPANQGEVVFGARLQDGEITTGRLSGTYRHQWDPNRRMDINFDAQKQSEYEAWQRRLAAQYQDNQGPNNFIQAGGQIQQQGNGPIQADFGGRFNRPYEVNNFVKGQAQGEVRASWNSETRQPNVNGAVRVTNTLPEIVPGTGNIPLTSQWEFKSKPAK